MFVKLKTGRNAGEVVEMKFEDARALIADGRAEKAYSDAPEPVQVVAEEPAPRAKPKAKKAK